MMKGKKYLCERRDEKVYSTTKNQKYSCGESSNPKIKRVHS
nr:hypothetical protein [uncultured Blautia sp.]